MLIIKCCCVLLVVIATASSDTLPPKSLYKWSNGANSSYLPYGPPTTSTNAEYNGMSACGGGGDTSTSFMCPHLMLLSPDMINAAKQDSNSWAMYGVAGIGQTSDCGKCFQLEITGTGGGSMPSVTKFIVQAINTGSDLSGGQFDIFIGAGGFGIYDACAADCQHGQVCSGGNCNAPMFSGNFRAWVPNNNCYGGGVHDVNGCDALVTTPADNQNYAEKTVVYGCKAGLEQQYHQNFQVNYEQVSCPKSLVQLSGIRSKQDELLRVSPPREDLRPANQGRTTTMMDCCKPTCAWRQNTASYTDSNWPQLFVCDRKGYPLTN